MKHFSRPAAVLAFALSLAVSTAFSQHAGKDSSAAQEPSAAEKYFTNTELVDQNGRTLQFYRDLLKNKIVIIDCFFATCQGSCLPMNRNLAKLQDLIGDRLGKDVFIVSISVDPEMDSPARLKEYAAKMQARPGWLFLTGDKANVEIVHRKLGMYVEDKNSHSNIVIIGNERTGLWKKAFGLAQTEELFKVVESVMNDKGQ